MAPRKTPAKTRLRQPATTPKPKAAGTTKKQFLIDALCSKAGADLATLTAATGWQPHTVRAALSRLKAAGYGITRDPGEDGSASRYRITGLPKPAGADAKAAKPEKSAKPANSATADA